ncbi:probable methyltransferase-like protein 24 [Dunckerocampus dactyliophorus]|uniref:probable methyltransferase-like protein 24 n=1 Tax=Dunckerocampus dactyliophorus TaxID=161453 RepID=UPI0024049FA1|nr:probable methyltransferase-like protein 24 [Dunckerocampus dactyliophorus]
MGLLLRLTFLLTIVCVSVHVYLETAWQSAPAHRPSGATTWPTHTWTQQGVTKRVPAEPRGSNDGIALKPHDRMMMMRRDEGLRLQRQRKAPRWHIALQPWASHTHSLEDEAKRFLDYITTPQLSCESPHVGPGRGWAVCLDPKYSLTHRMQHKHCRVYSFGLGPDDRVLERFLARSGCEVHCFDPSLRQPHLQHAEMWLHRLSIDWRDPNPAVVAQHQYANTKKLATILNDFGHRQVDVLKADMESAEWKVLENLILEGVLDSVSQLLLELHLHWAGFEVAGDDPSVVRYWFSLLKELESANFHLFHIRSDPSKPHVFLHKNVLNASSAYTLAWVNTRWTL